MGNLGQLLAKGSRLLLRSPLLTFLTIVFLVTVHFPTKQLFSGENLLVGNLVTIISIVLYAFLYGCVLGSFSQVHQRSSLEVRDFFAHGRCNFRPLLNWILMMIPVFILLFALAFISTLVSKLPMSEIVENLASLPIGWKMAAGFILAAIVYPYWLAPFFVVMDGKTLGQSVRNSYALVTGNIKGFLPFIIIFSMVPFTLNWGLTSFGAGLSNVAPELLSGLLYGTFEIFFIPTMVVYLLETRKETKPAPL